MNNDLQRCYQPNLCVGMGLMVVATLIFVVVFYVVENLDSSEADVTVYKIRLFDPFAKKIRIEGGEEPGNKIGISQTVNAQSGADRTSLPEPLRAVVWTASALSAFESRLMNALKTQMLNHDLVILPPDRPDTIEVYGYILEGAGGAIFMIDSIRPDNELFRETVKHTLEKEKVFVLHPTQVPYTVLFVRGQDVVGVKTRKEKL